MKKKRIVSMLLAASMAMSLVGCGGSASTAPAGDTAATGTEGGSAEAAPADGEKTIEFWSVFTGGDGEAMQEIVDAYNATNPEYKVVHRMMAQEDLYQNLPLAVQSGTDVPDLAINHVDRLQLNQENDIYLPMDEYIEANGQITADKYNEAAWAPGEIDGKRYAVPLDVHGYLTYYNKELVEKYCPNVLDDGVVTFDEIAEFAPTAAADGVYSYAYTWGRNEFLEWYAQLGGKQSEDGTEPSINNDIAKKVLTDWKAAVDNGWCTQDGDDPTNLFGQGQLIFLPEGTWMIGTLKSMDIDFGATYAISYDAKKPISWASSHQFVMPKKEQTPEKGKAIMDFIAFFQDNSLPWAQVGQCPATLAITQNPEFKEMPQAFFLDDPSLTFISDYKYYGYLVGAIDSFVGEVVFGKMDVDEALSTYNQQISDNIKNQ